MFELIGSLVEAVAGYVAAFIVKDGKVSKERILYISILTGLIFLIGFGAYNILHNESNWICDLLIFSISVSLITYIFVFVLKKMVDR